MSKLAKITLIVMAAAAGLLVGITASHRPGDRPGSEIQVSASEQVPTAAVEPGHSTFFKRHTVGAPSQTSESTGLPAMPSTATNGTTNWQAKLDETLASTLPDADKARQMLELFPNLPPEGQEEVAQHLANLLPDQDYALLNPYLTNAALPEDVSDVLLDDVLNRPNSLKLPALLEVARTAQHPKAAEAKDFLELFLDEDYGDNWDTWQSKMQDWLAANPD